MGKRRTGATTPAPAGAGTGAGAGAAQSSEKFTSDQSYKRALPSEGLVRGWDMHFTVTLIVLAVLSVATSFGLDALAKLDASGHRVWTAVGLSTSAVTTLFCILTCCTGFCFCGRRRGALHGSVPQNADQYAAVGLGSTKGKTPAQLYMDMVKRTVCNTIYQDHPQWLYDDRKQPFLAQGFDLDYRSRGEDVPRSAHTMVGLRRLTNVQDLVTDVVEKGVPGDLVETGVFRGGTVVFMKACLRALGAEDERTVYACDTFCPQSKGDAPINYILFPLLRAISSIPGRPFRMWLANFVQSASKAIDSDTSFPTAEDMSDNTADITMFLLRNLGNYADMVGTGLDEVKETFAKYGLLDDGVKFLKGYFSDTLPSSPISKVAVLRLDGDTYESTITALEPMYDRVAVGGYVIVDDYNSLSDCQKAIDEYRTKHNITDPLIPIDNLSVYWQKTA